MNLCSKIKDLTCLNCIFSEASEDEGFSLCNVKHKTMGKLCRDDTFCGEGKWASKVTITKYRRVQGEGLDDSYKDEEYEESAVRVDGRQFVIDSFLNDGHYDY